MQERKGARPDGVTCMQELELLEAELQAATREPQSADPFLLYLHGLVLSDRFVCAVKTLQHRLDNAKRHCLFPSGLSLVTSD